jgi:hypothetical protein
MSETIFNVFLPFKDERCDHALYVAHEFAGDDEAGVRFLQNRIDDDLKVATRVDLPRTFTRSEYNSHCRLGRGHELYDQIFQKECAGKAPLFVTSLVSNGRAMVNATVHHHDPHFYLTPQTIGDAKMDDWLIKYTREEGIDLPQLIHDDFFLAIKLTFNAGLHVSSAKLLVSCIDSVAYIEFGDARDFQPFVRWLSTHADLSPVGVTPEELWELRNSLLHMTNLSSRKVNEKKVRRISIRVGGKPETDADGTYFFEFMELVRAFQGALSRWIESYNQDRSKFVKFVERYDETISDSRMLIRTAQGAPAQV